MESSGYFLYDEQSAHIDSIEKYRALLKDSKNGNFVEEILDDLKEDTLTGFFISALSRFSIPEEIFITTDGYHYESILEEVSVRLNAKIRRQRCLLHMEKDPAHKIADVKMEDHLNMAKRLIKYMFFQNKSNMDKLGINREAVEKITEGMNEKEIVKINSLYDDDSIIESFLTFVRNHRKEVFLYLQDPKMEKTSKCAVKGG